VPCRVGHADRKGKVESGVGHTQATPLKGRRFESLAEAQAYLDHWDTRWTDTRTHGTRSVDTSMARRRPRGAIKRQVAAMFAEAQLQLRPLPLEPFRYYQYGTRTVHLDGCVEVASAYYAPPPGWLGREIAVQWDEGHVRLLDPTTGTLLREHRRQARGRHGIHPDDRPARTPPTTLTLLAQAARAGAPIGTLCDAIHRLQHRGRARHMRCSAGVGSPNSRRAPRLLGLSREATREEAPAPHMKTGITRGALIMRCTRTAAPAAQFARSSCAPTRGA
jgi:hypothetical protein